MRLFGEKGYSGASVGEIEAAAGLSRGAGGLYRHFSSKEALLAAGIARHLDRLDALRDVRNALADFGDVRTQLSATARYYLEELDSQTELLRILTSEVRQRPELLSQAVNELISSTFGGFAQWLMSIAESDLDEVRAMTISTLALGSLLSNRFVRDVIGVDVVRPDDNTIVSTWVEMVVCLLGRGATIS